MVKAQSGLQQLLDRVPHRVRVDAEPLGDNSNPIALATYVTQVPVGRHNLLSSFSRGLGFRNANGFPTTNTALLQLDIRR
jgi:hypothetical protein